MDIETLCTCLESLNLARAQATDFIKSDVAVFHCEAQLVRIDAAILALKALPVTVQE